MQAKNTNFINILTISFLSLQVGLYKTPLTPLSLQLLNLFLKTVFQKPIGHL